jgi:transposase
MPKEDGILVVDKAGWHTGGEVELPEGIYLEFLSRGSPELMPAERLWPLSNEALVNGLFEEIEEALMERCIELLDQPEAIRDLTNYHWGPRWHDVSSIMHPTSVLLPPRRGTR